MGRRSRSCSQHSLHSAGAVPRLQVRNNIKKAWKTTRIEMEKSWYEGNFPKLVPSGLQREIAEQWYGRMHKNAERLRKLSKRPDKQRRLMEDPVFIKVKNDARELLHRRIKAIEVSRVAHAAWS